MSAGAVYAYAMAVQSPAARGATNIRMLPTDELQGH